MSSSEFASVFPTFVIGIVFVPLGLAIFLHRVGVARHLAKSQKRVLGKVFREPTAGDVLGIGAMGIIMSLTGFGLMAGALVSAFSLVGVTQN